MMNFGSICRGKIFMRKRFVLGVAVFGTLVSNIRGGMLGDPITSILHTAFAGSWPDGAAAIVGAGAEFVRTNHVSDATAILSLDVADSSFTFKYVNNLQPKPENDGSFNLGLDGFEFTDPAVGFGAVTFAGGTGGFPTDSIMQVTVSGSTIRVYLNEPIIPGATTWTATWNVTRAPKLSIVRSGNNVIVSWDSEFVGYTLQRTANVPATANSWVAVPGSGNAVALPIDQTSQYFRLTK
jgi:hypothetical protein